jgi:hypothetical protein
MIAHVERARRAAAPDGSKPRARARSREKEPSALRQRWQLSANSFVACSELGQSEMSVPDDEEKKQNVVRLGTETLFAIAEQLRRMYDADLRTKPSEKLERLMRRIERGEDVP